MTKTAKNKEILTQLYDMVVKQASAPKPVATGVPGKDPVSGAVSEKHDKVDQNAVGPETNKPQEFSQKPSTDPAKPVATAKKAEETPAAPVEDKVASEAPAPESTPAPTVEKLGKDILDLVQKFANNPVATGVPSHDPKWQAVSDKHDKVDQNAVKPEHNPQGYHQKPAVDPAVPVAHAKAAEAPQAAVDADKVASYELGRLWAETVIKQAQEAQLEQVKQAGRRDFEMLIATAAEQMKQAQQRSQEKVASYAPSNTELAEKQAEAEGAAAFQALMKQAQVEQAIAQIVEENRILSAKLAEAQQAQLAKEAAFRQELANKEAEMARIKAEEREQEKFASLAAHLEQRLVERLQREVVSGR